METSHHFTWILLLFFLLSSIVSSSYENQCSSIVPRPLNDGKLLPQHSLLQGYGYARADGNFSGQARPSYLFGESEVGLAADYISETTTGGVLHVKATLVLQARDRRVFYTEIPGRFLYQTRTNRPVQWMPSVQRLSLDGYWSQSDGKLCMTGSTYWFSRDRGNFTTLSSVLVLDLKQNSTNITSLVRGTLRILDSGTESDHSHTISILGYNHNNYDYTLISQANKSCSGIREGKESLSLGSSRRICSTLSSLGSTFELEYESSCGLSNCNPLGKDFDFLPRFMALYLMGCSVEGKLNMYLTFSNTSVYSYRPPFLPNSTLVAEGFWDGERNQLCVMAGRILNSTVSLAESYVGDCNVGMSLRFPASLSLKRRSRVMGEIWSAKGKDDAGYFNAISFRSLDSSVNVPGVKYEYVNTTNKCSMRREAEKLHKTYPNPATHNNDMRFSVGLRSNGSHGSCYFLPLFLGHEYHNKLFRVVTSEKSHAKIPKLSQKLWNVSYEIGFNVAPTEKWREILSYGSRGFYKRRTISAEGMYDSDTGMLCMVGCRYLPQNLKNLSENVARYDCEISIKVQFPPLNPSIGLHSNASMLTGNITSTRKQSDSLYFDPLVFHSHVLYARQSERELKRMDFEIVMVLISLTLACAFIASQLHYVRRHPEVLSSISLLMLGILTLGLMIRLVLNFEALFSKGHSNRDVLLGSAGWREANEVIVRVITMVAFLLQFWLLQRTMSAKLADKDWLSSELRVLKYCISIYIIGMLIAWLVNSAKARQVHHSLWGYLQSYAGLVLDGFLLPQILHNLFSDTKQKPLAVAFYVGMTLVRALPHAYDVYRARDYLPWFEGELIYANADSDFYSPVWDIVIPCAGTVLALLIFVQQRFGGGSVLLPLWFRRFAGYEQVSGTDGRGSASEGELQLS